MTARFERRHAGVFDRQLGREIRREDREWPEYQRALSAGEVADPLPVTTRSLEARRLEVAAQVNGARARALERLVVRINGWTFAADTASYANLLGVGLLLVAGEPLPDGFTWRTADNELVPLTAAQVRGLLKAMVQAREAVYRRSWALKDGAIATSQEPEAIDLEEGVTGASTRPPKLP
jgi:hypothetical protein